MGLLCQRKIICLFNFQDKVGMKLKDKVGMKLKDKVETL